MGRAASAAEGAARLAAGAAALLAAAVILTSLSRSMIFPASPAGFPPAGHLATAFPGARLVPVPTSDGLALTGAFFPPPGADAHVLVYFHGNAEAAAHNLALAEALLRERFGVFLAEYRGYGGQPGSPSETGLVADGEAALAALLPLGFPPGRVVLVGRSLGTGVAVALAARHPVAAVVLVSPFTSVVDMGRTLVGPLAPLVVRDRFDSLGTISRVKAPVAILHGTRDDVVPVAMGRRLAAAREGILYTEVEEASHNDFPDLPRRIAREARTLLTTAGPR